MLMPTITNEKSAMSESIFVRTEKFSMFKSNELTMFGDVSFQQYLCQSSCVPSL
ncbi:hypothetical protein M3I01_008465 [Marinomonas sp. RSW2]|uniref:Uncharacterized protein n=1 Tax=Marinomonas maritima TaxID=2940935 RepID=A0ABT5WH25_9GAMM|nr:hypothetical protein [Marinomonas maritima]MDE8602956.1 hypothetical protein [Marinomonas maritima]